ncbi:acetyl-CoA hydrolase/transferase C-terminal domain-containing protein [Sphingobium sp. CR2-8]|uniref:acetyl-CoA hydrolase/transferase C-terminal domain-containing protein n=1 Tax=Sphingobium sp. CR2-8 TaxID=1306534 RepID=UPI002DB7BE70|nr:acetyl-CoA hydrolase/transferase C-terminal domain-containing protein [Sphingobium sp. CR2-8]MEC3909102.1 acetyl-CoA hydrolase/transferase C-terminal domain-containing protein [Sphingobium sp. CR2-8]
MPIRTDVDALVAMLPSGGRTMVSGCSVELVLLADALDRAGAALGAMTFTGIFVPGLNRRTYLANPSCRTETFFLTPELKAAGATVTFFPLCYADIRQRLINTPPDAALMMLSPPDEQGMCSFGPTVDFMAELWPSVPVRLAHINPLMPRTRGQAAIPLASVTAIVELPQPLLSMPDGGSDPVADAIAGHIAPLVPDGATLQTGLGKVPGALFRALTGRRNLRVHSGLIGDGVVDLEDAGALAPGVAVTAGVAIGSERLYQAIAGPAYRFAPVALTHDGSAIGAIRDFIAVNSATEVDLFGQAYAEVGPKGLMSGPGGASDFARGAKLAGGIRIVALAATAAKGAVSRIVAPNAGAGPVSLGRMDVDIVVTEFGRADLRGATHEARAAALIAVAAPDHRAELTAQWQSFFAKL